jgi:hypothetical protein
VDLNNGWKHVKGAHRRHHLNLEDIFDEHLRIMKGVHLHHPNHEDF